LETSRPNISLVAVGALTRSLPPRFVDALPPEQLFNYFYAVFHSPGYRARYSEFLKTDFPRVPPPGSLTLFVALANLGAELVSLHLLELQEDRRRAANYVGPESPVVARVGWSTETVWLDTVGTGSGQGTEPGTIGFRGVSEAAWKFHVGGYQPCEKWLTDRKGRTLSAQDIAHYQKIVVAISETIRLMGKIDEVIDQHGGWPGAFAVVTNDEPPSLLD
jgi:predicted helicase